MTRIKHTFIYDDVRCMKKKLVFIYFFLWHCNYYKTKNIEITSIVCTETAHLSERENKSKEWK